MILIRALVIWCRGYDRYPDTAAQRAEDHHAPHFAGVPGADQRYHALLQEFGKQTGLLTGAALAAACRGASGHD